MLYRRTPLLPFLVLSLSLSLGCEAGPDPTESGPGHTTPGTAGMRAYIDPETGELGAPPPDQAVQPVQPVLDPPPTSGVESPELQELPDLIEEPGPVSGIMVDPKGKFDRPLTAMVGPDGRVTVQHQAPSTHQAAPPDGE